MRLLAALALLSALGAADDPPSTPLLDRLGEEAARSKTEFPDRWAGYQRQVERANADHAHHIEKWTNRGSPPPLDLKPLGLPLAFLVAEARLLGEAPDAIDQRKHRMMAGRHPVRFDRGRSGLHQGYLDAIAHHADERRIEALLEYTDALERRWPGIGRDIHRFRLIAEAASRDWAVGRIRDLGRDVSAPEPRALIAGLPYHLIDRFAGELPPDAAKIAYGYLRHQDPLGPRGGERVWDVLLRVDPARARREILPYFHSYKSKAFAFNIHVVRLLVKHAGPSPEVANEVRTWLAKDNIDPDHRRDLRVILLRADPEHELKPTVEHIDRLLTDQVRTGEPFAHHGDVHFLVLALGEIKSKEADEAQARYVFERAIPDGIRALALESLAKHDYPGTQALLSRWLAEEAPHMQEYLRKKAAEEWGESGRRMLQRIDQPR